MKNLILYGILSILLWAVPAVAFCQTMGVDVPIDILTPSAYFGSLLSLTGLVVLVTAFINKWLKIEKKFGKQLLSWGIGIALGAVGKLLGWGIFIDVTWLIALAYGLMSALMANGAHAIKIIKSILVLLKLEVKVE